MLWPRLPPDSPLTLLSLSLSPPPPPSPHRQRPYNDTYLKALRVTLDAAGFPDTMIVAPDAGWDIAQDILDDPVLAESIHAIGCHYPGTHSSSQAEQTGKPLWASEDDSTYNNDVGAGCWARVINQVGCGGGDDDAAVAPAGFLEECRVAPGGRGVVGMPCLA